MVYHSKFQAALVNAIGREEMEKYIRDGVVIPPAPRPTRQQARRLVDTAAEELLARQNVTWSDYREVAAKYNISAHTLHSRIARLLEPRVNA